MYGIYGLTTAQAAAARERYGSNELAGRERGGFWRQFLAGFGDPIIKILLTALAVNLLFLFTGADWIEPAGIAAAILLATFVSTLSEYGSENAFRQLQEQAARSRCRVWRDGAVTELPVGDLVVGDIVLLGAGERIPADGTMREGQLSVDQAALNGESREALKRAGKTADMQDLLSEGAVFRGAVVTGGEGLFEVLRVGAATFYGGVARELQEDTRESPLKVRLSGLAATLSRLGYLAAALVALASLFYAFIFSNSFSPAAIRAAFADTGYLLAQIMQAMTLAITVVVVAVPEGLPMMITVVLSANMRRMLRDHVLVRKLVGIETSGSLNILFTDKTGTLTRGKPAVTAIITGDGVTRCRGILERQELWHLITLSGLANSDAVLTANGPAGGNATDRALMDYVLPQQSLPLKKPPRYTRAAHLPFDSANKFSAAQITAPVPLTLIKGAPELLLDGCRRYYDLDGTV
ncbi:MAG: cation-transporting P-type ATPase, partial [Oscillospiraceae bacterium]|nr:cation-transporting P-type ATPase [Oscillospiraceae bacterium]